MSLSRCRVVLVRTNYAGNIGAAARVMRNFGLGELVLVDPVANPLAHEARQLATRAVDVLDSARVVADLGEAVGDCVFALGTAGVADGPFRQIAVGTPEERFPQLLAAMESGPVALVFGPEPHGLANAEVARCHGLVCIPTDPAAPSLNLAQAVAVCAYELYRLAATRSGARTTEPVAPVAEQERMYDHLQRALEAIHFLYGTKAGPLMHAVRQFLGRAMPTEREVKMLHGVARQLLWAAQHLPPKHDPPR
jgi:tRNA/rRNA methyltransferase